MNDVMKMTKEEGLYHMLLRKAFTPGELDKYGVLRGTNAYLPGSDIEMMMEASAGQVKGDEISLKMKAESDKKEGYIVYTEFVFRDLLSMEFFCLSMARLMMEEDRWIESDLLRKNITYRMN